MYVPNIFKKINAGFLISKCCCSSIAAPDNWLDKSAFEAFYQKEASVRLK